MESDTPKQQHSRPKLLQFHENRRPPYWGTWTKCSDHVKPRAPFGRDKVNFQFKFEPSAMEFLYIFLNV